MCYHQESASDVGSLCAMNSFHSSLLHSQKGFLGTKGCTTSLAPSRGVSLSMPALKEPLSLCGAHLIPSFLVIVGDTIAARAIHWTYSSASTTSGPTSDASSFTGPASGPMPCCRLVAAPTAAAAAQFSSGSEVKDEQLF